MNSTKKSNKQPLENARVRENRLPRVEENYDSDIITHQIPPVKSREPGVPEVSAEAGPKVSSVTGTKS